MKILIVDDSSVMRKIVQRSLRQAGFTGHDIEEADSGVSALEKVGQNPPDLILADWNMPEMSGIALLEQLRAREHTTQFCFITSEASHDMRRRAFEAGADAFVTKPFTPEALQQELGKLIS